MKKPKEEKEQKLEVSDYTAAVEPLLLFLRDKFPPNPVPQKLPSKGYRKSPVCISDSVDQLGRQGVDLVQEGGGVHGIALSGYTYMLEAMGVTFTKMAGTSAGAINTMLLSATYSREELEWLKKNADPADYPNFSFADLDIKDYYGTRSEKLLEYLSQKDLSTLVDGHSSWRKIILSLFRGKVKLEGLKAEKRAWKRVGFFMILSFLIMLAATAFLVVGTQAADSGLNTWVRILGVISLVSFICLLAWLLSRAWQARILWFLAERMGINPGNTFLNWIKEKLELNKVKTVDSLREKLELETNCFGTSYEPDPGCYPIVKEEYELTITENEEAEKSFNDDLNYLRSRVNELEQSCSAGDCRENKIDEVWDIVMAMTRDLPSGNPIKDELAARRSEYLMPLFMRLIRLKDAACGYVRSQQEIENNVPITTGPYTKELTLITTDITNEIKVEFPAMHTMYWGRDFSISPAAYVRASMALPFFFTPFKVKYIEERRDEMEEAWQQFMRVEKRHSRVPKYQEDANATLFVDGGAVSNFPINIYATPEMPIPRKPTLGIKLEYEDETISNEINNIMGEVGSIISTMRYFYDRDFISKHDMYNRTVRSIDTGQIHWLNFDMQEKDKLELFYRGALAASFFLISGHPDFDQNESAWYNRILEHGTMVPCAKPVRGVDTGKKYFSIYSNDMEKRFRNEDRENSEIRFKWSEYKQARLLDLSRLKHQRNILKKFPK